MALPSRQRQGHVVGRFLSQLREDLSACPKGRVVAGWSREGRRKRVEGMRRDAQIPSTFRD
ncbi:hypothetical protein F441_10175 [Phytophthora nicotianae CJ01A1]|uniref:Uncharacterized protein n=4 Tax=Phytophthora nicotianae TaxID=4792 RepID=V9F0S5_PHYNI|nr:hypothetical protein F443_10239 [Phytophthora nicotianae P1569]ETL91638.1 hypothetical protein L917_09844 [Phytophthora nicotianae]ETP14927.1 hypothetical protein F441_10175 [Phytophthora nicotianae CJ01A1]ETP42994.1 hypothetical protein F442_10143 [Phytophthora nicotianae P10297]